MAVPAVSLFGLQLYVQLLKLGALTSAAGSFISPLSAWLCLVLALNGAGTLALCGSDVCDIEIVKGASAVCLLHLAIHQLSKTVFYLLFVNLRARLLHCRPFVIHTS